jgi:SAM-dependent methyltransferase
MSDRVRDLAIRFAPRVVWRARAALRRTPYVPPVGRVRFGDLRRTAPVSSDFGYRRGGPVDRYYIEGFLGRERHRLHGRVLEIGENTYTLQFGDDRVTSPEVLHIDDSVPGAAYVGDLADGSFLPDDTFDAVVLTQTLHLIYDFHAALRTVRRILAPGGALLLTVPGITNVDPGEWGSTWHYSFSQHSVKRMFDECFPDDDVTIESHGNVLAAVAFLHGLGAAELRRSELDATDRSYGLVHCVRAVKRR